MIVRAGFVMPVRIPVKKNQSLTNARETNLAEQSHCYLKTGFSFTMPLKKITMQKLVLVLALLLAAQCHTFAQASLSKDDDGSGVRTRYRSSGTGLPLRGHVVSKGEHLPFVSVTVKGTTIGTATDESGHFLLVNLPEGKLTVKAQAVGYKPSEKEFTVKRGETKELIFDLQEDVLGLEEVVVTGDRNEKNRRESSVIVNTITPKLFNTTNAVTLSEGLNFSPGVRMENDCQNCGFNQVRMNGMEGPYSQILINGRPVFSGLAGVYGLELIPSNMLERIEIVRGGGSALYGSNAIAGTINLILRDPIRNSYEFGLTGGRSGIGQDGSGSDAGDYSVNGNTSVVSTTIKAEWHSMAFTVTGNLSMPTAMDFQNSQKSKIQRSVHVFFTGLE